MIYPHTVLLHSLMAILSAISLLYLFFKKESLKKHTIKLYFNWFLFFFLYNVFLVLPLLIFNELNIFTGVAYVLALLFLSLGGLQGFMLGLSFWDVDHTISRRLSLFYLIGAIFAVLLHVVFFEVPHGSLDGNLVLWYMNQPVSLFYALVVSVASWMVACALLKNIFSLLHFLLKIRLIFLSLSTLILPFAALFYFGATDVMPVYIAFLIVGISLSFFIMGNIGIGVLRKLDKRKQKLRSTGGVLNAKFP